jgi:ribonuclease P protein component
MADHDPGVCDARLRKAERLARRAEFLEAQRLGGRSQGSWLVLYVMPTTRAHARLGITTSRKVGNAVVRNRWRRLIREAFRHNKTRLPLGHDLVVIVKAHGPAPSLDELTHELVRVAGRAAQLTRAARAEKRRPPQEPKTDAPREPRP